MNRPFPIRFACISLGLFLTAWRPLSAQVTAVDPSLPDYHPRSAVSGKLEGSSGMDTVEAMMAAWNQGFRKFHPDAEITISSKDEAPEDRIALGPRTEEVFRSDNRAYEDAYGCEPFRIKIALAAFSLKSHVSAIGVYVNQANPISRLSLAKLDAIFSEERRRGYPADITTWGQLGLGGDWADKPIHPCGFYWRDDVTFYFRELAMLGAPFKDAYRVPGEGMGRNTPKVARDLMATLASDPYAIGFANFSYLTGPVKALALSDSRGVIGQPTPGDVATGRYPLERALYIYVNREPGKPLDPLAREFLTYVLSKDGQELVGRDHYLPLPAGLAAAERAKLD